MNKTTLNKKSATWQYKGKKDLVIPVNLSPYEALRMVGVPFNPYTLSGFIRPQNASYGVKNSFHKRPWKGSKKYGSAVDLTPAPGYTYDDILRALAHPALQAWAKANGYGILDERPASVRKRTNATGPHLHFGPDRGATKIYANPLIAPHYSYWKSLGMKTPEYNGAEVRYNNTQGNINVNTPVTVSNNSMQYLPLELILTPLLQPVYIPALQQVNGFDLTYNNYDWSNLFDSAPQKSNLLEHVLPLYNYEYSNNINLLAPFLFSDILGNSSISEPEEKKLKIRFAADGGFINTFKDGGKPVSFNSIADMIKAHEGFRATPYKNGRNKKTGEQWYSVGYGFNDSGIHHNIGKKYIGKQMTRKEADNLLLGYITHLQGTLKKTLGDKIYNSLTPGQMMAYIDTGYQRPATMINAAKLHRKTGNINNVANALAVKGYNKRNANRRNAFLGNISINQQSVPEYQEVILPVQIPQMLLVIYQLPITPIPTDIPESSIVEDYNYLNDDEYTEDVQKPNMAIVSANPELYGELFNNTEFLKAMFEPLGVTNNLIKNVENKKLQFKHISAEGGALVIDNGNDLVDNQDWDSYAKQKFSECENYQVVPDLTEEEIQKESNGMPLYAKGGEVNIFDGYSSSYIPRGMREVGKADDGTFIYTATPDIMKQYYPDLFNLAPSSLGYMFLGKGDNNYTPMKSSEHRYDKFIDYNKLNEIKNNTDNEETYINLPEIEVTPQSSTTVYPELSTYDDNVTAANAYDPYNNPAISAQLNNLFNNDPVIKELRRRFNDMAVANRTLGRNNWWEGVGIAMTPFNLVMPSNIYGSIAKLIQEGGNFADYLLSGNNLGFAQTTQGTRDWAEQHPYLNTGVNLLGDALTFWAPRAPRDINAAIRAGSQKYNYYKLAKELGNNIKNTEFDWNYSRPNFNRTRIGDLEINNPNTMYHIDNGNKIGAFNNGAVIENGVLKAGIPKNIGDVPYVWWNLGKPYMNRINGKPANRIITSPQTEDFIHVRSQNYPIGLWNGNTGFVTNAEYVTQKPLNVNDLNIYNFDPNYGYRKTNIGKETQPIEFNVNLNIGELKWNPETGDFKSTTAIDNDIIQKYALEQAVNKISRGEELNKLDKIVLGSREAKLKNAENLDNIFNNYVFSRLDKEYFTEPILNKHTRMPEYFKRMQEDKFKEFESALSSGEYTSVDLSIIDTIIGRGFGGYYNPNTNKIVISNGLDAYEVLPHEFRHMLDNVKGLPEDLQIILDNAYNSKFENLPELVPEGDSLKGYNNMRAEKVTTNFDARKELLGSDINLPLKTLNRIIDQSSDKAIINAVKNSNGYGKKYIKVLEDWIAKSKAEGLIDTDKEYPTWLITAFKNAMKYVPTTTGIAYGINKTN